MAGESRRSFARKATATIFGGATLSTVSPSQVAAETAETEYEREVALAIHDQVNRIRSDRGIEPLAYSDDLAAVAAYHSQNMAEEDYFSHTSPDGESMTDRYDKFDLECRRWGENILYNYESDQSPTAAARYSVEQWMGSDGHRKNILSESWTAEGIGAAVRSDGRLYVTQNFGTDCV